MAVTPIKGITFREMEGSPRVSVNTEGVTAVRTFYIPEWDDWTNFTKELIGDFRVFGFTPQFTSPIQFPGRPNLIVDSVDVEPFQSESPNQTGQRAISLGANTLYYPGGAKITATYKTNTKDNRCNLPTFPTFTTLNFSGELGAEMMTIPGRTFRWNVDSTPLAPDINPGIVIPTGNFTLSWDRVPRPPWDTIRQLRGKVNSAAFNGSPTGCLMFLGARISKKFQFYEDDLMWNLEYTFSERIVRNGATEVGWNYFYREDASGGNHWLLIEDQSGNPPYASGDFTTLFAFATAC